MIAVVDLDIGNLANVKKALGGRVTEKSEHIRRAEKIVLPGVGNFGAAMGRLEPLRESLTEAVRNGKPFLGICLGMQLLFEESEEQVGRGLGICPGKVVRFRGVQVPHIGWNQVHSSRDLPLLEGIEEGSYFYFVHSYYVEPEEDEWIAARTEYRSEGNSVLFPSVIARGNVFGTQFHPEKSSDMGLQILKNFKEL